MRLMNAHQFHYILARLRVHAASVFLAADLCFAPPLQAVDTMWVFDGDGNWAEAANWSNGEPIDETYNVIIDDGDTAVTVTLNDSRVIGGFALGEDDTLRIEAVDAATIGLTSSNGFTNAGTIRLTSIGSGQAILAVANGALTNALSGVLQFDAGAGGSQVLQSNLVNEGTVLISRATTFDKPQGRYNNSGLFTIDSGLTIRNEGEFENAGGALNVNSFLSLSGGSVLNLSGGSLNLNTLGRVSLNGSSITQTNGILTAQASSSPSSGIIGGAYNYLGGAIEGTPGLENVALTIGPGINNQFTFLLRGNNTLTLSENSLKAGQNLTIQGTSFFGPTSVTSALGFDNFGSISLTNLTSFGAAALTITEGSLVNGVTGLLHFAPRLSGSGGNHLFTGDLVNNGTLLVDAPTTFDKPGGTYRNNKDVTITSRLTIANGGTFEQAGGTLIYNTTSAISGGTFRYLGGTIDGTPVLTNATLSIGPGVSQPFSFVLQNANSLKLDDNYLAAGQTVTLRSTGSSTQTTTAASGFTNDGSILLTGIGSGTTTLVIQNGTLLNAAGGFLQFQAGGTGSRRFTGNLTNDGTVLVDRSTTLNKTNGAYINNGELTISSGQTLTVASGGTLEQPGGTLDVHGTLSLQHLATLELQNGALNLNGSITQASTATFTQTGGASNFGAGSRISGGRYNYLGGVTDGALMLSNVTINLGPDATSFRFAGESTLVSDVYSGQSLTLQAGTLTASGSIANRGSIDLSGSLSIADGGDFVQAAGLLNVNGNVVIRSDATLTVSGGTLNYNTTSPITGSGKLSYLGGKITGTPRLIGAALNIGPEATESATFLFTANSNLTGQLNSGQTIIVQNEFESLSFPIQLTMPSSLTNAGSIVLTATGASDTGLIVTSGTLTNSTTGLLHFQTGGTSASTRFFTGDFINEGTVLIDRNTEFGKTAGIYTNRGQFTIAVNTNLIISNSGTFEQEGGALEVNGELVLTSGPLKLSGGELYFNSTSSLSANRITQEGGALNYLSGVAQSGITYNFWGGTVLGPMRLSDSALNIGDHATGAASFMLTGDNTLTGNVHAGQLLIQQNATKSSQTLTAPASFTNGGKIVISATDSGSTALKLTSGTLVNGTSGLLHFQSGGTGSSKRTFTGDLINSGTVLIEQTTNFDKSNGAYSNNGQFTITVPAAFDWNAGTFEQVDGTLQVDGTMWVNNGGVLNVSGGTLVIDGRLMLGDPGRIDGGIMNITGGIVTCRNYILTNEPSGKVNLLPGGVFHMAGNGFDGGGELNLAGGSLIYSSGLFRNNINYYGGTIQGAPQIEGGTLRIGNDATEPAVFHLVWKSLLEGTVHLGQTIMISGPEVHSRDPLTNNGLLHFLATGTGEHEFNGELINNGTVLIDRTTTFDRHLGEYVNSGLFTIASGRTLSIANLGNYGQHGGTTIVDGTLSASTTTMFAAGRLMGNGTIAAAVEVIGATVEPGQDVGRLMIQDNYTQHSAGSLVIELGGAQTNEHDLLAVTGSATLGGTLDVRLVDLGEGVFSPAAGDTFEILTATGGVVNRFENELLPALGDDLVWRVLYGSNAVSLAVTIPGDLNGDFVVDAADYVAWRKSDGSQEGYDAWRANFGRTVGAASGAAQFGSPRLGKPTAAVPEPAAALLLGLAIMSFAIQVASRRQRN